MKLIEKLLIVLFILSILLKAFEIIYSNYIFIITLILLTLHYFPFGIYTIINIKENSSLVQYTLFFGFSLSLGLSVILLNILLPNWGITNRIFTIASLILLSIGLIVSFLQYKKNLTDAFRASFFSLFSYRFLVLIILELLAFLPSSNV